jgi:hypothetical protein
MTYHVDDETNKIITTIQLTLLRTNTWIKAESVKLNKPCCKPNVYHSTNYACSEDGMTKLHDKQSDIVHNTNK